MNSHHPTLLSITAWLVAGLFLAGVAHAGKLEVVSADPALAEQETLGLEVLIDGDGFDDGTQATFIVSGTRSDTGGITVLSTTYLNPGQLRARIDVAGDATLGLFDIVVETSRGRRGKGNTLFKVTEKQPSGGGNSDHDETVYLCATVVNTGDEEMFDDGKGVYCDSAGSNIWLDGFEGRLRFGPTAGTRKTPSDRAVYTDAKNCSDRACDLVTVQGLSTGREHRLVSGQYVAQGTAVFWDMVPGEVTRVEGKIVIDDWRSFKFSTPNSDRVTCPTNLTAPMWLRCDGKSGTDPTTFCDLWTISSLDLGPDDPGDGSGKAFPCLVEDKRARLLKDVVELDFTLGLCVPGESC